MTDAIEIYDEDVIVDTKIESAKAALMILGTVPVLAFGILYMLGSFTAGTLNASEWTGESKGFFVFFWLVLSLLGNLAAFITVGEWYGTAHEIELLKAQRDNLLQQVKDMQYRLDRKRQPRI